MIIALSQSTGFQHEAYDHLNHSYSDYFFGLGFTPLLVPNGLSDVINYVEAFDARALVLTGGRDWSAAVDGADANTESIRGQTETALLTWAIGKRLPVLGICRGLHVLNVFFGGHIVFNVSSPGAPHGYHVARTHTVELCTAWATDLLGVPEMTVNSYHENGIRRDTLAAELHSFAICPVDDLVEGVRHYDLPVWGIQWHPERSSPGPKTNEALLKHVLECEGNGGTAR